MRYLVYVSCFVSPHLETELEIAKNLISEGKDVKFVVCDKFLKRCFINPTHCPNICNKCYSRVNNGLKKLNISKSNIYKISYSQRLDFNESFGNINSIEELTNFEQSNNDIGKAVLSNLVSYRRDHKPDFIDNSIFIFDGLQTALNLLNVFSGFFDELKPDFLIMFNGRFLETRPLLKLCERYGINYLIHERGAQISKYILVNNNIPHSIQYVKGEMDELWNLAGSNKYDIGKQFFLDRRKGAIQNWVSYIVDQKKELLPTGFDFSKRNFVIFNSSIDEYVTIPEFDKGIYLNDNDAINKIVSEFILDESVVFYLRVHPNLSNLENTQNRELNKLSLKYTNIKIIGADSHIDSYALMENCEAVITMGSTMGCEALFWGKPSILISRAYYEDIYGILKPQSHEQLISLLKRGINGKKNSQNEALKYGYYLNTFGIDYKHYEPQGLFDGTFLGEKIKSSLSTLIKSKVLGLVLRISKLWKLV